MSNPPMLFRDAKRIKLEFYEQLVVDGIKNKEYEFALEYLNKLIKLRNEQNGSQG